jgi:hypothetical protein
MHVSAVAAPGIQYQVTGFVKVLHNLVNQVYIGLAKNLLKVNSKHALKIHDNTFLNEYIPVLHAS